MIYCKNTAFYIFIIFLWLLKYVYVNMYRLWKNQYLTVFNYRLMKKYSKQY